MKAKRIQRKRTRGWKAPENSVYVGRPTVFGNPFTIENALKANPNSSVDEARFWVMRAFHQWLCGSVRLSDVLPERRAEILRRLPELRGKTLLCWCPLHDKNGKIFPCHADVLLEMANEEN